MTLMIHLSQLQLLNLDTVNKPKEKLTPEEYKTLLFTIINKSEDTIAIRFKDTIVDRLLEVEQEII